MPITPFVNPFIYSQSNTIEVRSITAGRPMPTRKVMLQKAGSMTTGESLNDTVIPMHIPGSSPKLAATTATAMPADSLSKSPTKRELMNTAFKHSIKIANSPPLHRRSYSYASSPNKPSPLQIRVDDQHRTFKDTQTFDAAQPKLLRKKSGEVVRPVLKFRASKSEPSTPTCSKNVRFDTQLERVRLFLQAETPTAVVEDSIEDDSDYGVGSLTFLLPNLPPTTTIGSQGKPVHVDVDSLSHDRKTFSGKVQVQNLAYHKRVDVHYTFDFWQTVGETQAHYKGSTAGKSLEGPTHDIFVFSIPLDGKVGDDMAPEDEQTTMYFAIKYSVNDSEHWDNNNGCNYQVEFKHAAARCSPSPALPKAAPAKSALKWTSDNEDKDLTKEFGVSPPSFSSSPDMTSVPTNKSAANKKFYRYDFNASLTAEKKNSSFQTQTINHPPSNPQYVKHVPSYFNTTPGASGVPMVDGYPISIYSEDSLSSSFETHISISSGHWNERGIAPISAAVPIAKRPPSEKSSSRETTTGHYTFGTLPINCPRPNTTNSPTYYDLVQKYCFYGTNSNPCSGSPYSNSPPAVFI